MLSFEAKYRQEAMEVPARASFGLLKIWIGRFYLGFWGVVALVFGVLGSGVWFWQVLFVDPNRTNNPLLNFIRGQIYPPPPEVGPEHHVRREQGLLVALRGLLCHGDVLRLDDAPD
jgi:hypothetical protein